MWLIGLGALELHRRGTMVYGDSFDMESVWKRYGIGRYKIVSGLNR